MEKLVYLCLAEILNAEGNKIYKGPHEITGRGWHNHRRITRYHHYIDTPQQLEDDKLPGIFFM